MKTGRKTRIALTEGVSAYLCRNFESRSERAHHLDSLLGLVPVAGDAASAAVSISLIARSIRYGIPREVVTKMLANVLLDLLLGAVPLVGDLADVWFKANERNVALLKQYLGEQAPDVIDVKVTSA